jgi:chromate reductase
MPILQQPEAYLTNSPGLLDENGQINNEATIRFLQSFVNAFLDLLERYQA